MMLWQRFSTGTSPGYLLAPKLDELAMHLAARCTSPM
jgi:hypothetical protein